MFTNFGAETLAEHIRRNGLTSVNLLNRALSDHDRPVTLNVPRDGTHSQSRIGDSPEGDMHREVVKAYRLDSVVSELALQRIDVMKIDVEGHEANVLSGGERVIGESHPAIFFEANHLASSRIGVTSDANDILRSQGYSIFAMTRLEWALMPIDLGVDPRQFAEPMQALNLLALHPGTESWARLAGRMYDQAGPRLTTDGTEILR